MVKGMRSESGYKQQMKVNPNSRIQQVEIMCNGKMKMLSSGKTTKKKRRIEKSVIYALSVCVCVSRRLFWGGME